MEIIHVCLHWKYKGINDRIFMSRTQRFFNIDLLMLEYVVIRDRIVVKVIF